MYQPAAEIGELVRPPWNGTITLLPMAAVYVGSGGSTAWHGAPAHKVVVGAKAVTTSSGVHTLGAPLAVPAGIDHRLYAEGRDVVLAYLDARRFSWSAAQQLARNWEGVVATPGMEGALAEDVHRLTWRSIDDRLLEALSSLGGNASVGTAARIARLSESRFTHVITERLGVPPRRWRSWLRLRVAVDLMGGGANVTDASHAAGFTDAAHLSRTCAATVGVRPSLLRSSRFDFARSGEPCQSDAAFAP